MTTASDSFNRANETPIASPWSASLGGGANLASNALTSVASSNRASYYTGTWADNQESSGTVGNLASTVRYALLLVRADGSGNALGVYTDGISGANHSAFVRYTNGSESALGSIATTFAAGDKIRLTVEGQSPNITLTAYKDTGSGWVQVGQLTGLTGPNSGAPGAGGYGTSTIDDWNGADLGGGGSQALEGAATAGASASGAASVTKPLAGDAVAGAQAGAALSVSGEVDLAGAATGGAAASAALTVESRRFEFTLYAVDGATPLANKTGLWWAWWDVLADVRSTAPDASGTGATTDASGVFSVVAPSALSVGDNQGFGIISDQDATPDATEAAYVGSFDVV